MLYANMQQHEQLKIQVDKPNQNVVKMPINCARYLSRQDLPFREHTEEDGNYFQLIHLMVKCNPLMQRWLTDKTNTPYQVCYGYFIATMLL